MSYWLFKSEPNVFSIDDLMHAKQQTSCWDGVRNYQVRNMLRDQIKKGDLAFFYHSSCSPPGIVGVMRIVKDGYLEPQQSTWYSVDVQFVQKFPRLLSLDEIKKHITLKKMLVARKGNRLSITPVTQEEWGEVFQLI